MHVGFVGAEAGEGGAGEGGGLETALHGGVGGSVGWRGGVGLEGVGGGRGAGMVG